MKHLPLTALLCAVISVTLTGTIYAVFVYFFGNVRNQYIANIVKGINVCFFILLWRPIQKLVINHLID